MTKKRVSFSGVLVSCLFLFLGVFSARKVHVENEFEKISFPCFKVQKVLSNQPHKVKLEAECSEGLFLLQIEGENQGLGAGNIIKVKKAQKKRVYLPDTLGGFIYGEYLFMKGIENVLLVNVEDCEVKREGYKVMPIASNLNLRYQKWVIRQEGLSDKAKALILSLTCGERSFLDFNSKQQFKETGVFHVLAISGLHVGLVYFVLVLVLRVFSLGKTSGGGWTIILLLWVFCFFAGCSPSILRACLMFSLLQIGRQYSLQFHSLNLVFVSAMLCLVFEPLWLWDVGFQLSYLAVIGILLGLEATKTWFKNSSLWERKLGQLLIVNFSAFLFTTPILLFHFHKVYPFGVLVSLVVIPLITIFLIQVIVSLPILFCLDSQGLVIQLLNSSVSYYFDLLAFLHKVFTWEVNYNFSFWQASMFLSGLLVLVLIKRNKLKFVLCSLIAPFLILLPQRHLTKSKVLINGCRLELVFNNEHIRLEDYGSIHLPFGCLKHSKRVVEFSGDEGCRVRLVKRKGSRKQLFYLEFMHDEGEVNQQKEVIQNYNTYYIPCP